MFLDYTSIHGTAKIPRNVFTYSIIGCVGIDRIDGRADYVYAEFSGLTGRVDIDDSYVFSAVGTKVTAFLGSAETIILDQTLIGPNTKIPSDCNVFSGQDCPNLESFRCFNRDMEALYFVGSPLKGELELSSKTEIHFDSPDFTVR